MTFNSTIKALITALGVCSTIGLTNREFTLAQTQSNSTPVVTTFRCVPLGNGYATIAQRGERKTPPMITWNSTTFGPQFTPHQRCEIVSDRLTKAVAVHGGKLTNLLLTYGNVHRIPAICYVNTQQEYCNDQNLLLTLNQSDRGKEGQILMQIVNFGKNGTSAPVVRGGGDSRTFVDLGTKVNQSLGTAASDNNSL